MRRGPSANPIDVARTRGAADERGGDQVAFTRWRHTGHTGQRPLSCDAWDGPTLRNHHHHPQPPPRNRCDGVQRVRRLAGQAAARDAEARGAPNGAQAVRRRREGAPSFPTALGDAALQAQQQRARERERWRSGCAAQRLAPRPRAATLHPPRLGAPRRRGAAASSRPRLRRAAGPGSRVVRPPQASPVGPLLPAIRPAHTRLRPARRAVRPRTAGSQPTPRLPWHPPPSRERGERERGGAAASPAAPAPLRPPRSRRTPPRSAPCPPPSRRRRPRARTGARTTAPPPGTSSRRSPPPPATPPRRPRRGVADEGRRLPAAARRGPRCHHLAPPSLPPLDTLPASLSQLFVPRVRP